MLKMKPSRVAVANSVGIDSDGCHIMHSPSRWSQGMKNFKDIFTYYPWELAYTSSLLKRDTAHEVRFFDGCLDRLDLETYKARLAEFRPEFLIMEPASRTLREDLALGLWSKREFGTRLIYVGQHATAYPKELIGKGVDHVCQGEYEPAVLDILQGRDPASISGLYPNSRRALLDFNALPFPEDSDVRRIDYATPGEPNCEYTEIQMYATRGCPLMCNFCIVQNLYFAKPNHRVRSPASVVAEIALMKERYPSMEGVFFDEEMHNANKKFILELSAAIQAAGLEDLKYNAMCGHFTLDREMLEAMKAAGYYKVRVGIETADTPTAEGMLLGPKHKLAKLEENLLIARELGINIYATFSIGGRGSSIDGDRSTGEMIRRLVGEGLIKDIQISINTPLPGGPFFEWARGEGYLIEQDWSRFDGGNNAVVSYPGYSNREIEENFQYALKCYDDGLKKHKREGFVEKLTSELLRLPEAATMRRVLILRSTRMWEADLTIDAFSEALSPDIVDVIGQPKVASELEANPRVDNVYLYRGGFFKSPDFQDEFGHRFDGAYDAVVILYSNLRRVGFGEVEAIAREIDAPIRLGVLPNGGLCRLAGAKAGIVGK